MNNLKRVLSTVLAGTMLAGMMVVGASAAGFPDADKIEHTEAVNTLVALNVINGKDDGNYDPEGSLTRAEMAKLAVFILHGGKDPVLGVKATPTYTDIKGNWAESYIEYCSSLGIIGGRGDGTFDPNGTVTGTEAAKMMLVAMGWDATIFNFTGADWAINVAVEANKIDLFDELETINPAEGLTRDNTAQLIFNGLLAPIMEKAPSMTITNGEITWGYSLNENKSLFSEKFGGEEKDGVLTFTAADYDSDKGEYTYTVDGEEFTTTADYTDLFRQSVRVLYKETKTGTSVYGIFAKGGSVLAETIVGNISDLAKLDADTTKVKIDGVEYKVDVKANGKNVIDGAYAFASNTCDSFRTIAAKDGYKAFTFQAIDTNDNGKIDTLVYFPFTVEKVSYVGKTSFKAGTSVNFDDVDVYDGIAKNDWVKITAAANTVDNTAVYEKIDTIVSGKVTAIKDGDVKIGGEWYTPVVADDAKLGTTYKDMPVVNGYIFSSTVDAGSIKADEYAVLTKAEEDASGLNDYTKGILLLTGGTKVTVDLKANYKSLVGKLVTFEVEDDVYTLTEVSGEGAFDGVAGNTYKSSKIDGMTIADDAVIFIANAKGTSYKVITGAELKKTDSITVNNAYYNTNSSTGFGTIALAYVTGSVSSTSDNLYGYVTAVQEIVNDDDDKVKEITLWTVDGEVTVTTKAGTTTTDAVVGKLVVYKVNSSDLVTSIVAITADNAIDEGVKAAIAAVEAYDGTNIKFSGNSTVYKITDDTVILYIDSENEKGVEGGKISLADKTAEGAVINNVYFAVNSDKEVVLLVVDDANEMQ